jgi:hypothetical protein
MEITQRIKQHQEVQRKYPHLTPDEVELMLINKTLQPDPKPDPVWVDWLAWLLVPVVMLLGAFLGLVVR